MDINITVAQDIRKARTRDFPGGPVIKSPPCKVEDAVQALVQNNPTCRRTAKPRSYSY